jgi:hypothetical protein
MNTVAQKTGVTTDRNGIKEPWVQATLKQHANTIDRLPKILTKEMEEMNYGTTNKSNPR